MHVSGSCQGRCLTSALPVPSHSRGNSTVAAARKKAGGQQEKKRSHKKQKNKSQLATKPAASKEWTDEEAAGAPKASPSSSTAPGGAYPNATVVQNDDGIVDTAVTDRMLRRVLTFSGIPVFVALLLYPGFWYLKVVKDVQLPMGTVFVVQSLMFGAALLGITYGATSASWDPNFQGSALGWREFQTNFAAIMGKLGEEDKKQ